MKAIIQLGTVPVLAAPLAAGTANATSLAGSVRTAGGAAIEARVSIRSASESVHLDTRNSPRFSSDDRFAR